MTQTVTAAVATRDRSDQLVSWIRKQQDDIAMAAASHVKPSAVIRVTQGALRRDPKLLAAAIANPQSLLYALLDCARLGHEPDTDDYYLVPFGTEVTGIEGYKGIIERMFRAGGVTSVVAQVVRKTDRYAPRGENTPPLHEYDDFASADERGPMRGAYAYAIFTSGHCSQVIRMGRAEIMEHKAASRGSDRSDSPWQKWEPAMWKKGLALDTPIPTPAGWTAMDRILPGDFVFDRDGQPTRVAGCSEVKHVGCYRIRFRSGPAIICDDEHLWPARIGEGRERTYPIGDLYAAKLAGKSVRIPVAQPVDLPAADVPIDPWLLGYWLGDGDYHRAAVTCNTGNLDEVTAAISSAGYEVGAVRQDPRSKAVHVGVRGDLLKQLAEAGLLGHKHVPAAYLRGSAHQRLALLCGLMDSDGCAERSRRRVRFGSTLPHLRDAVAELARSLGEQVLTHERDAAGYGKTVRFFEASWTPTSVVPFALSRKSAIVRLRIRPSYGHQVSSIERIETVPTRCIGVESPSRTYLAGRAMIPTHNTVLRGLEPYVPTSNEFRTLNGMTPAALGSAADRAADFAYLPPPPANVTDGEIVDAEIVDEPPPSNGTAKQQQPKASPRTARRKTAAAGDDTRSRSRSADGAQDGAAGDSTAQDARPRAAGAAPSRGAQPLPPPPGEDEPDPAPDDLAPGEAAEFGTERHQKLIGVIRKNLVRFGYPLVKDETDEQRTARLDVTAKLAGVSEIGSSSDLDVGELSKVANALARCKDREALDELLEAGEISG